MLNAVILMGRLTKDPIVKRGKENGEERVYARYCLAVNRDYQQGDKKADFVMCNTFGKRAVVAEERLKKGDLIVVRGRMCSGSYINQEGYTVYTTEVMVEQQYFTGAGKKDEFQEREMTHSQDYCAGFPYVDETYTDMDDFTNSIV